MPEETSGCPFSSGAAAGEFGDYASENRRQETAVSRATATALRTLADLPVYDVDYYGDAFIQDPYPHYAAMRELGPLVALPQVGTYAVMRHADIRQIEHDWETYSSAEGVAGDDGACVYARGNTLQSDPPRHDIMREKIIPPLLPGALEEVRPRVQRVADELIDRLLERGDFDAIDDFARVLPLTVVRDLVGLPDEGREQMLSWASASFDFLGGQNERWHASAKVIFGMRDWIASRTSLERLRPGSWTARIREMEQRGEIDPEMAPQLVLAYIPPSLDTTIAATGEMLRQLAQNPDQWDRLRSNPELIKSAVQEAIRLATPIRSFTRKVVRDAVLAGTHVPKGTRLTLVYASANRDERQYSDPQRFLVDRNPHDHLSFGSGIHMCAGMHLARLEMECLLQAMLPRVSRIEVGEPTVLINNSIRAYAELPASFERAADGLGVIAESVPVEADSSPLIDVVVQEHVRHTSDVVTIRLASVDGSDLPAFEPGAHIDVEVAPRLVRQYSLCGDPEHSQSYRIAVKKTDDSRGGSIHIHDRLGTGMRVRISKPRNLFRLDESAQHSVLFAGGIGITPLLTIAAELSRSGRDFELHYSVRSAAQAALLDEVAAVAGHRLHLHVSTDPHGGRLEPHLVLSKVPRDAAIYICGPTSYAESIAAEARALGWSQEQITLERFSGSDFDGGAAFELIAARSGRRLEVPAGKTALEVLEEAGIDAPSSCRTGVCATCLVPVVDGVPDHRDLVQTDAERMSNSRMAVCCSRALTPQITLDI